MLKRNINLCNQFKWIHIPLSSSSEKKKKIVLVVATATATATQIIKITMIEYIYKF